MDRTENQQHASHGPLLVIIGVYLFSNFVGIGLTANRVLFPPWGVLFLFSFFGPAILAVGLLSFQCTAERRLSWTAAVAYFFVIAVIALCNISFLGQASASV